MLQANVRLPNYTQDKDARYAPIKVRAPIDTASINDRSLSS